jgi:hypothetical protein
LEELNNQKKRELLSDVKRVLELQKQEKLNLNEKLKNMNREIAKSLERSYSDYIKDQENNEKQKKEKISLYRLELDKQLEEKRNRLLEPLMNENERLLNREILKY